VAQWLRMAEGVLSGQKIANFGNEMLPTLEVKNCQLWKWIVFLNGFG